MGAGGDKWMATAVSVARERRCVNGSALLFPRAAGWPVLLWWEGSRASAPCAAKHRSWQDASARKDWGERDTCVSSNGNRKLSLATNTTRDGGSPSANKWRVG